MSTTEPWLSLRNRLEKCGRCRDNGLLDPEASPLFCKYEGKRADVLFVLEAPNLDDTKERYLTYDRDTDPTGRFFRELYLNVLGERIEDLAVTNSVLCLPAPKKSGKSTTYPVNRKLRENCSDHLRAQVESLDPLIVVTLGVPALAATRRIEDHGHQVMRNAVGLPRPWFKRTLFPLYHPGMQVRNSPRYGRSADEQRRDWEGLRALLESLRAVTQR